MVVVGIFLPLLLNFYVSDIILYNLNFIARRDLRNLFSTLHFTHEDAEAKKWEEIYPRSLGGSVARTGRTQVSCLFILGQNDLPAKGQKSVAHTYQTI